MKTTICVSWTSIDLILEIIKFDINFDIDSGSNNTIERRRTPKKQMTSERRADESAMESRFEVLEEETHYPATHPQSTVAKKEQEESDAAVDEAQEEETLEAKLDKLMIGEDEKSVKNASKAKELGNECVLCIRIADNDCALLHT